MSAIAITRAGPLTTLQDAGRFGHLADGISASGPMDQRAFHEAGALLARVASTGIEFTSAGLAFTTEGPLRVGCAGGQFRVSVNGNPREWPARLGLNESDVVEIRPGPAGNYGYLRFNLDCDIPTVLGSRSTNLAVGLGGWKGRALRAGDRLTFGADRFHVLDTTHPKAIRALEAALDLERTLFVSSSKSGSTLETRSHTDYFWEKTGRRGDRFCAVTDPGSQLEHLARERGFRAVFSGEPSIGGRYSALSPFGIVPAVLMGIDAGKLLERAQEMREA